MKTKRSTLIGLLSTLLVIVTVLSSVLVFTATAGATEPEDASDDRYVYADKQSDLQDEVQELIFDWNNPTTWYDDTSDANDGFLIIDLNEIGDYDIVEIGIGKSNGNYLYFAFLEEKPEAAGDAVVLTEGTTVTKYEKQTTGSTSYKKKYAGLVYYADIPEGANYLAIRARSWGTGICPYSLAFERTDSNLLNSNLDSYAYPMSKVIPSMAVITNGKYEVVNFGDYSTALIPIEGTTFDAVTFQSNANHDTTTYTFLTETPVPTKKVSYAGGMTANASAVDGEIVKIPEDAKYLALVYKEYVSGAVDVYLPDSITFVNWVGVSSTIETTTVAYNLVENGCVYGWDNDHTWVETYTKDYHSGFVDLTDRDYTKVSFTVGSSNYLGYAFLNRTPILNEKVSYAGGVTSIIELKDHKEGDVVTVAVPDDATTIVVWMREGETNYAPSAISLTYVEETEAPYDLELKLSAEARLNANSGLRFTTRIPTAELAGLDYTVGTLIFPTDKLNGALTVDTDGVLDIKMTNGVAGNEYTYFSAAMTSIFAQNYAREFTAVSYIEVGGKYYYTAATSSSVYEAAVETYKANEEDANADAVRAYIDGVVVIEGGKQVMPYDGYEHALTATITDGTLTITGDAALATVIIDGVIYTGGWTTTADGYTATID